MILLGTTGLGSDCLTYYYIPARSKGQTIKLKIIIMKDIIFQLRKEVDALFRAAKTLPPSREVSLCVTLLQQSKMSMGRVLGALGEATPYPESKNIESKVIEPEADTAKPYQFIAIDQVGKVKELRARVTEEAGKLKDLMENKEVLMSNRFAQLHLTNCYLDTDMANMWLGMELGRIRDTQAPPAPAEPPKEQVKEKKSKS